MSLMMTIDTLLSLFEQREHDFMNRKTIINNQGKFYHHYDGIKREESYKVQAHAERDEGTKFGVKEASREW